ncbi:tyrosine-type recombinase/integrase [Thauera aromatica]|uniref:tyrosine-type recombinase/integrase n=1 Tax=Thauera aromatica TaxID=59405 RepID=UPI001FFC993F|nr:site-specific integrase [Thauera aromatica]MCK2095184.1 site-specific integrase [Thauera aromatica]
MATIIKERGKWRAMVRRVGAKSSSKSFQTKAEAVAWARQIEAQIDAGEYRVRSSATLAEVIVEYRKLREHSVRPISDKSNEHYQLRIIDAMLGDKRAEALDVADLVEFAQKRHREGAGPYTINMDIGRLGTVLRHTAAVLKLRIPDVVGAARPVLHHLGLIGGGGKRERRPTDDELERIADYCRQQAPRSPVWTAMPDMMEVALQTGMRRGELLRIRWADLDEARRVVLVRDRKDPRKKAGNDQWVPLVGDALAIILRQPHGDEEIFPFGEGVLSKYFRRACQALSIPDLHWHDLRHEAASRLIEAGWSAHEVRVVTGHATSAHLDRYVNLDPAEIARKPITPPAPSPESDPDTPPRPASGTAASSRGG